MCFLHAISPQWAAESSILWRPCNSAVLTLRSGDQISPPPASTGERRDPEFYVTNEEDRQEPARPRRILAWHFVGGRFVQKAGTGSPVLKRALHPRHPEQIALPLSHPQGRAATRIESSSEVTAQNFLMWFAVQMISVPIGLI
jgi:hypothetical protein